LCAIALIGCSAANREERSWTEDVLLEDGTAVRIERHVTFNESDALGGGAYSAVESKSTLKFTGQLAALPAWDFPRIALVLYRSKENGSWRIIATTSSCEIWKHDGAPRPPYWEYELIDTRWELSLCIQSRSASHLISSTVIRPPSSVLMSMRRPGNGSSLVPPFRTNTAPSPQIRRTSSVCSRAD